ncbi:hypothetical protein [Microcoleus sp. B13-B6]
MRSIKHDRPFFQVRSPVQIDPTLINLPLTLKTIIPSLDHPVARE